MVKKLRYYARFIVVSLLLNKVDLVKELIQVIVPCHFFFKLKHISNTSDAGNKIQWMI